MNEVADFPIPTEALDGRLAIVGMSGSGKSTTAKGAVETLLSQGRRVCIVDLTDVWFGLRRSADNTQDAFAIPIFGGRYADMLLPPSAGATIGQAVAQSAGSTIVSLSEFEDDETRREFALDFFNALYKHNRAPLHLIIDEADFHAPQLPSSDGPGKLLLNRLKEITARGRVRGFRTWLITQRTSKINKDALSQADTLVAMQLSHQLDRNAIKAWIGDHGDETHGKEVLSKLSSLQRGEGIVWSPRINLFKTVQFSLPSTYDSMRTPEYGEDVVDVTLAALDLGDLRTKLVKVEAELKANSSEELRRQIDELRAEKKGGSTITEADLQERYEAGVRVGVEQGVAQSFADLGLRLSRWREAAAVQMKQAVDDFLTRLAALDLARITVPIGGQVVAASPEPVPPVPSQPERRRIVRERLPEDTFSPADAWQPPPARLSGALSFFELHGDLPLAAPPNGAAKTFPAPVRVPIVEDYPPLQTLRKRIWHRRGL